MVRPERFELPAFWFPPQADSIQLNAYPTLESVLALHDLVHFSESFPCASLLISSHRSPGAQAAKVLDSWSIWSLRGCAAPRVASSLRYIRCTVVRWFRFEASKRKTWGRVVRPERFELPTFWFVARRSIQLSYERIPVTTTLRRRIACRYYLRNSSGFRRWRTLSS